MNDKVVIFRQDLLPVSQTFVLEQARGLKTFSPVLVGFRRLEFGLPLTGLDAILVPFISDGALQRWMLKCRLSFNRPIPQLIKLLNSIKPKLVHVHFGTDAVDIWPSIERARLPMLVTLHGFDINTHAWWWQNGNSIFRRRFYPTRLLAMARSDRVTFLAVSNAIKERAIEYGIPEAKIKVSYIGVDVDRFMPSGLPVHERKNKVVFVGRMIPNKSPFALIRACSRMKGEIEDFQLVMIGDGPLLGEVKALAEQCGVKVDFLGAKTADEIIEQLGDAKVLCLPSRQVENGQAEGLGQVLLEAQACGVPVVGARTGGIPEALRDGITGYVFDPENEKSLEEKILRILHSSDQEWERMSVECRRFVSEKFNLRKTTDILELIYREC